MAVYSPVRQCSALEVVMETQRERVTVRHWATRMFCRITLEFSSSKTLQPASIACVTFIGLMTISGILLSSKSTDRAQQCSASFTTWTNK